MDYLGLDCVGLQYHCNGLERTGWDFIRRPNRVCVNVWESLLPGQPLFFIVCFKQETLIIRKPTTFCVNQQSFNCSQRVQ